MGPAVADGVLGVAAAGAAETAMPIAILYHDVVEPGGDDASGFPGPGAARYKLTRSEFAGHLEALAATCVFPLSPASGERGRG